jgi:hypothetical protein
MTPDEIDRLAGAPGFYSLYLISLGKHGLAGGGLPADLQLRFLRIIEGLVRGPITPAAAAVVDPAPEAAVDVFWEAQGNSEVLERPEVRRLLAKLNPTLLTAMQVVDRRVA